MLSTALTLVLFATAQPAATPFTLDAPGANSPKAMSADWTGWTDAPAEASAKKAKPASRPLESAFATIELVQGEIDEIWNITIDGGSVGKLSGREARLRVGMLTAGRHDLAIFNERGTLWSGRIDLRSNQTLLLEATQSGIESSDPMALQSHAELQEERFARGR